MARPSGPIAIETIKTLLDAIRDNAEELVADATLLFEHERYPRTYALAELAVEEFAKWFDLFTFGVATLLGIELPAPVWEDFWKKWADHGFKTQIGLMGDFMRVWATEMAEEAVAEGWTAMPGDVEERLKDVRHKLRSASAGYRELIQQRLDALYVDCRDDRVVHPVEQISRESAKELLAFAERNIEFLRTMPGDQFENYAAALKEQGVVDLWTRVFESEGIPTDLIRSDRA